MDLESRCIANDLNDEEGDRVIWQEMMVMREEHFMFSKTL